MRNFKECVVWGDLGSDRTSEQYPTEIVCEDCVRRFDKPDVELIVSVNRDVGEHDESECYFSDRH